MRQHKRDTELAPGGTRTLLTPLFVDEDRPAPPLSPRCGAAQRIETNCLMAFRRKPDVNGRNLPWT